MRLTATFFRIHAVLLLLLASVAASFAANPTIVFPRGLAVDAKGNLYVANAGGNNILVYSPTYVLQSSETITQGISSPYGVTFDLVGDLWVANNGNGTLTNTLVANRAPQSPRAGV